MTTDDSSRVTSVPMIMSAPYGEGATTKSKADLGKLDACLTVRQLKDYLEGCPDFKADGDPSEVWLFDGTFSNECRTVWDLNGTGVVLGTK